MASWTRRAALAMAGMLMAGKALAGDAFDFQLEAIEGGPLDLGQWRGKPVLVVNTASFCGFTPQYAGLQKLYSAYRPRGLVVLGVPSQDFNQESADNATVKAFCDSTYNVEFPMTALMHVRGAETHPFFRFLADRGGGPPRWNFHKYLVARDGRTVHGFRSQVEPDAPALLQAIEAALAAPAS
ncbi:glutathione peroxidase [Siccirubricoccus sp. KC 17139]|uniref:Glutathione peroxidase n=1 Tax=Siccirubricoccus soli TaxID=2899147 RepID=A0ABT1D870_9PROT|nr:glutathione peroxidase [Siccirubricoccus soli]MCO6417165.1 glutathione peroxidase [Siccirubricoccus soli]MCP2683300.1 glutathione peroxidase [Siccirubricoccus soli]